ncbi:hypothetical protein QEZ54_27785 [Catellatospora sp. KI3]|uniref:hypothetical protein n=1 Tax=Catellatospora sp. KI3 TaxID=3041620 RepID=UPI002482CE24|nr:hypothetical protein [Catellatospora sp. KI3]MDI1464778.1 hypothetical protein [Catellatospora sp. KI3]
MTVQERLRGLGTAAGLRIGVLCLAAVAAGGTAVELAAERHWDTPVQLLPWAALALLAAALLLLAVRPRPASVRTSRVLAAIVLFLAAIGVWEHVEANFDAGWLDALHGSGWDSLPTSTRWWYAVAKVVGPAPPLAPGVLAQASLLVLLAAWRHPASAAPCRDRPRRPGLPGRRTHTSRSDVS